MGYITVQMKPILETKPPFVIKIFDSHFHISSDGLFDRPEDRYYYDKIKSLIIKKGQYNKIRSLFDNLLMLFDLDAFNNDTDPDELIIEFKNGKKETRYFNDVSSNKYLHAINLINKKLA